MTLRLRYLPRPGALRWAPDQVEALKSFFRAAFDWLQFSDSVENANEQHDSTFTGLKDYQLEKTREPRTAGLQGRRKNSIRDYGANAKAPEKGGGGQEA